MATKPIKVFDVKLQSFLNGRLTPVGRHLHKKGKLVERAAKAQVGVDTRALRKSIHMRHHIGATGQYVKITAGGASAPHALMHHEGTRPHVIVPKDIQKKPVLRFTGKTGVSVHARIVKHPGTKPNRYLTDNLRLVL
jgi:hypothetical protein